MRIWGRVLLVGGMVALASPFGMTGTAGATPSHPGGVADTCPEVLAGSPTGAVDKSTDPPPGSEVARGTVVEVTLRWDPARFTGRNLHKVLDCVTVDGRPVEHLSVQQRDPANTGVFTTRMTVPEGLPDGTQLCDRGFVSGPTSSGQFGREKSNDVCFTVRGDGPGTRPDVAEAPAVPPAENRPDDGPGVPAPPDVTAPPVLTPAPQLIASPAAEPAADTAAPTENAGRTDVAGVSDQREEIATLPRTGTDLPSMLLVGLALLLAGQVARHAGHDRSA